MKNGPFFIRMKKRMKNLTFFVYWFLQTLEYYFGFAHNEVPLFTKMHNATYVQNYCKSIPLPLLLDYCIRYSYLPRYCSYSYVLEILLFFMNKIRIRGKDLPLSCRFSARVTVIIAVSRKVGGCRWCGRGQTPRGGDTVGTHSNNNSGSGGGASGQPRTNRTYGMRSGWGATSMTDVVSVPARGATEGWMVTNGWMIEMS